MPVNDATGERNIIFTFIHNLMHFKIFFHEHYVKKFMIHFYEVFCVKKFLDLKVSETDHQLMFYWLENYRKNFL